MYSSRLITLVFLLFTLTLIALAQHQGHQMPKPTASPTAAATPLVDTIYGNHPISWKVFFRIRPGRMDMSMHGMHGTNGHTNKPVR